MELQPYPEPVEGAVALPPIAEIVTSVWPVSDYEMRISLSFLARAGAHLARALEERNAQYEALRTRTATSAVALNAPAPALLPNSDWAAALAERDETIVNLESQIDQLQAEIEATAALDVQAVAARREAAYVADHQAEVDQITRARARAEQSLQADDDELAHIEQRLASLHSELLAALPDEAQARLSSPVLDMADGVQRRSQRLDALAASIAALIDHSQVHALHSEQSAGQMVALQQIVEAEQANRLVLETDINEKDQSLEDLQTQLENLQFELNGFHAQVEQLKQQIVIMQGELDQALEGKRGAEQQLAARSAEAAALSQENQALQAALHAKALQSSSMPDQTVDLQAQIAQLNEDKAMLSSDLDLRIQSQSEAEAQFDALNDEVDSLTTQVQRLTAQIDDLQAELQTSSGAHATISPGVHTERSAVLQKQPLAYAVHQGATWSTLDNADDLAATLARLPDIKRYAAEAAASEGVTPLLSARVQALTDVHGIGSVYQQRLYNAGVGTYWELATLPEADFPALLHLPELQATRMNIARTRADARSWAERSNTVGLLWDGDHVDDLESLSGIGRTFEKRLYEAGITTYAQLAACDRNYLAKVINAPEIQHVSYEAWIEQARAKG